MLPILLMALLMALTVALLAVVSPTLLKKASKLVLAALPLVEPYHTLRMERILSWKSRMEL